MSSKAESEGSSALDLLKWLLVVGLVAGAVIGNWYFQDETVLYRVLAIVAVGIVALLVAAQTVRGRWVWALIKESRSEIRRVVWPTQPETVQTTFIVLGLLILVGLILWGLDSFFSFVVAALIG